MLLARVPINGIDPDQKGLLLESKTVSIAAVGDIIMHLPVKQAAIDQGGYYSLFQQVKPHLKGHDIVFGNLETTLYQDLPKEDSLDWPGFFRAKQVLLGDLQRAGFSVLSVANNHMADYETHGYYITVKSFERYQNLYPIGVKRHPKWYPGISLEKNGIKIAMVAYTTILNLRHPLELQYPSINYLESQQDIEFMLLGIAYLKENHDIVIVSIHWGDEYEFSFNRLSKVLADRMSKAGADIILGHHSHVLQRVETISGKIGQKTLVLQSMGNFISNQGQNLKVKNSHYYRESAIFKINVGFHKFLNQEGQHYHRKTIDWNYIPLWSNNVSYYETSQKLSVKQRLERRIQPVVIPCRMQQILKELEKQRLAQNRQKAFLLTREYKELQIGEKTIQKILGSKNQHQVSCQDF